MKIAVIGATRGIGLEVVKAALAQGHDVTVLVRDPTKMPITDQHLYVLKGDSLNPVSIKNAVEGQDVVCDCLGTKKVMEKTTLFSESTKNLCMALEPEQLLITVTGIGTGNSKGSGGFLYDKIFMPVVLKRMYADKDRQEEIIMKNVARWVIVRPGFLNDGPRTGHYRALTDLDGIHGGKISRADVADFILSEASSPKFLGQTPLIIY